MATAPDWVAGCSPDPGIDYEEWEDNMIAACKEGRNPPMHFGDYDATLPRASIGQLLGDRRRDQTSGLLLGLGTLAVRYFLPPLFLAWNGHMRQVVEDTALALHHLARTTADNTDYHVSGSLAEGLVLTPYEERDQKKAAANMAGGSQPAKYYESSDIDVMIEVKDMPVSLQREDGMYMDQTLASHAGYARVVFVNNEVEFLDSSMYEDGGDGTSFLSSASVVSQLCDTTFFKGWNTTLTGPAMNGNRFRKIETTCAYVLETDFKTDWVPALPLTEMPPEVHAWMTRAGASDVIWPPKTILEDIRRQGRCFLVATGHPLSKRRDLEWRLSFSDLERRLAHCLTHVQKKMYLLTKLLQKCFLQQPKVLVTYHVKTLFFWELELSKLNSWEENNVFEHLLNVIDRMERCLEEHCIPSYFIPENNLISHISKGDVAQVLAKVRQIRQKPLKHVYGIDDRFRFRVSTREPLSQLCRTLLEAVESSDVEAAPEALSVALLQLVFAVNVNPNSVVPGLLRDAWLALKPELGAHPMCDSWTMFAAVAAQCSVLNDDVIVMMEALWKAHSEGEELTQNEMKAMAQPVSTDKRLEHDPDERLKAMQYVMLSGTVEQTYPITRFLIFHHALIKYVNDEMEWSERNIEEFSPLRREVQCIRLQLQLIDDAKQFMMDGDVNAKATSIITQLAKNLVDPPSIEATPSDAAGAGSSWTELLSGAGVPVELASKFETEYENCRDRTLASSGIGEETPFETNPRVVQAIPLHNAGTCIALLAGGLSEREVDNRHTTFFNMVGFLLRHELSDFLRGLDLRMVMTVRVISAQELGGVIYSLHRAPMFLRNLPAHVSHLMRMTSCRAALGAVYFFVTFINIMFGSDFDEQEMSKKMSLSWKLSSLEGYTDASASYADDVALTHLTMWLCARQIAGLETAGCLRALAAAGGAELGERAARELRQWEAARAG